jgi:hypothetical protein
MIYEYKLKDLPNILKAFHNVELEAKDFLSFSAFAMKYPEKIIKNAKTTLKAIDEYKKLPLELRKELENDKNNYVSNIIEIEKICKKAIEKEKI